MPDKLLQYDVLYKLGEGAGSTIYAVRDPVSKKTFAMKHVPRVADKDIRYVEQMKAEFEISRHFAHANLRKCYDLKISRSILLKVSEAFMLMELVDGKSLDLLPPSPVMQTIDTFLQAAQGIRAMHVAGYVHCDIKQNNIIRNDAGEVKVIDFGQTAKIGTVKERIQGTPDFIAPEQVLRRPIVPATDVYNLGATLYFALTRRPIPTLYTVNKKGENSFLLDARVETPSQINSMVPQMLSNLVMECVSSAISKRPATMDVVINRLELAQHSLNRASNPSVASGIDIEDADKE